MTTVVGLVLLSLQNWSLPDAHDHIKRRSCCTEERAESDTASGHWRVTRRRGLVPQHDPSAPLVQASSRTPGALHTAACLRSGTGAVENFSIPMCVVPWWKTWCKGREKEEEEEEEFT